MFIIIPAIIALVIADQLIKEVVIDKISKFDSQPVIDGFFYLTHVTNKGAAWSLLQGMNIIFIPITIIVCSFLFYYITHNKSKILTLAGILIISGALGNFIDRMLRADGVIDYLEFHFGSYIFPIFNLADSLVVCGSILLGYYILFIYGKDQGDVNAESIY